MKTYGLIGKGISHTYSPQIHEYIFEKYDINATYRTYDLINEEELVYALSQLKNNQVHGYNITAPYKEVVMKHLDIISENAKAIGAVNTVYFKNGQLHGDNTDYYGLYETFISNKIIVKNKRVFILGAGGTAKTAKAVLEKLGAKITLVVRPTDDYSWFNQVVFYKDLNPDDVDLYVNTTPVGMYPNVSHSVLTKAQVDNKPIIDVIYNPQITKLMSLTNNKRVNGMEMFLTQAFKTEAIWQEREIVYQQEYQEEILERILK